MELLLAVYLIFGTFNDRAWLSGQRIKDCHDGSGLVRSGHGLHISRECMFTVLPDTDENLALNKPASQISTYLSGVASLAVDGRQDTMSCTSLAAYPWLSGDLGAAYDVGRVTVTNDWNAPNGDYLALFVTTCRPHRIYMAYRCGYKLLLHMLYVGLLVCHAMYPAKTAGSIQIPFGVWAHVATRNHVLDGD